jgi:hypothetical protein
MSTGDRNALDVLGEHDKDTIVGPTNRVIMEALSGCLRRLIGLKFLYKGRATIYNRFLVTADELAEAMAALQVRPGQPTPALLHIIGAAVYRANKPTKGGEYAK